MADLEEEFARFQAALEAGSDSVAPSADGVDQAELEDIEATLARLEAEQQAGAAPAEAAVVLAAAEPQRVVRETVISAPPRLNPLAASSSAQYFDSSCGGPAFVPPPPPQPPQPPQAPMLSHHHQAAFAAQQIQAQGSGAGAGAGGGAGPAGPDKRAVRMAAGDTWVDRSLADWPEDDHRIFVGDLGPEASDELLFRLFKAKYPSVQRARVVKDRYTNRDRGYGFVSFADPFECIQALREMDGKYCGSRPMKLKKSTWKDRMAAEKVVRAKRESGVGVKVIKKKDKRRLW